MEISPWTVGALVVVVAINTLFVAGLAIVLFLIWKKTDEALKKTEPLLEKATQTLSKVEASTAQVHQKVDLVLDKTTTLVDKVAERVDTTTAIAEEAVTEPLIGAASLMAGIHRGLRAYAEKTTDKGADADGKEH